MAPSRARRYLQPMRSTPLERAFQLARSGEYAGVDQIRRQLRTEGFDTGQLSGPQLMKQLRQLCAQARRTTAV